LSGDQSGAVEIIHHFHDRVFYYCLRMLGHQQDAEDTAQESFLRAFKSLSNWDDQRPFAPWLMAIAGNRCRTQLAKRKQESQEFGVDQLEFAAPCQQDRLSIAEEIKAALCQLRDEHRQAFELFHNEQLNYMEIAERLGCPLGTVKTWVHRARRELVERLQSRLSWGKREHALREI